MNRSCKNSQAKEVCSQSLVCRQNVDLCVRSHVYVHVCAEFGFAEPPSCSCTARAQLSGHFWVQHHWGTTLFRSAIRSGILNLRPSLKERLHSDRTFPITTHIPSARNSHIKSSFAFHSAAEVRGCSWTRTWTRGAPTSATRSGTRRSPRRETSSASPSRCSAFSSEKSRNAPTFFCGVRNSAFLLIYCFVVCSVSKENVWSSLRRVVESVVFS